MGVKSSIRPLQCNMIFNWMIFSSLLSATQILHWLLTHKNMRIPKIIVTPPWIIKENSYTSFLWSGLDLSSLWEAGWWLTYDWVWSVWWLVGCSAQAYNTGFIILLLRYHWLCVGINSEPSDNQDWFCTRCMAKKQVWPRATCPVFVICLCVVSGTILGCQGGAFL